MAHYNIPIRYAKVFCGTKNRASYRTELQYYDGTFWVTLDPERAVWVSPEDKKRYEDAERQQYLSEPR